MNRKLSIWLPLIMAVILAGGIQIGMLMNGAKKPSVFSRSKSNTLDEVLGYVQAKYVDTVNLSNLEENAVANVLEHLDPHSTFIPAEELKEVNQEMEGNFEGIGISGRLGIVDASECPPTFGVPQGFVIGVIAGGDAAIRKAKEFAEDDLEQGWKDLEQHQVSEKDVVVGITASGTTPYVIGAIRKCRENNITTGCITCNKGSELAAIADFPVEVVVGPEFVTGSTRMKAGTAQKLVLNMISTSVMIKLGRILDNKMVDMQLTNEKLIDRGARMLMRDFAWDYKRAKGILLEYGSVRKVLEAHRKIPKL